MRIVVAARIGRPLAAAVEEIAAVPDAVRVGGHVAPGVLADASVAAAVAVAASLIAAVAKGLSAVAAGPSIVQVLGRLG